MWGGFIFNNLPVLQWGRNGLTSSYISASIAIKQKSP